MKPITFLLSVILMICMSCKQASSEKKEALLKFNPISHGTLVIVHDDLVIYVDPVGGTEAFQDQKPADVIVITDVHGDHLNVETLEAINQPGLKIIAPSAVASRLPEQLKPQVTEMANNESINLDLKGKSLGINAIPMYNLREEALQFHEKGRGNGYVLNLADKRIYISGDTEDIPEMRALTDIDYAFVCMNLPWTMPVERAASAVLEFQPKVVFPYHYRGTNGLSDIVKFKALVRQKNATIDVRLLNWYPNR